ncbi:ATP-binding cassette subfamily B protein/ATP-binding cassette subfamily C protein/ATP-binding cassette subfamily B multidrug efflux pump [Kushneria sinocarnis]|uniref:ATP-binding cassette subfamily B protein/ATP-binding cassette subfamily C protein/ATP-binding cassette subfamily B multidrug efflux pump n=1 Tax=Kushneria sinocarnis TaxID=595502 RepID=A0A420X0H2_9GAMM|nr:ABC transporter transmembrane domain-containing protein [Kushneria sinocarnis]RKR07274.1 ATP-binding cassette subfamily B protein/ATP-binding cassette subfamily C protein/ATP-binding cassette subfamily B multidrug efflux pump [Kushneria sinocarnis]
MNRRLLSLLLSLLLRPLLADRRRLLLALLVLVIATGLDVMGPWLAQVYIDDHLVPGDLRALPLLLGGAYVGSQGLAALGRYLQTLYFARIGLEAVFALRQRVFRHVLRLPQHVHDATPTGEMVARVTNDTDAIRELHVAFLATVLQNLVLLAGILVAMALMNLQLMLIAAPLIPIAGAVIWLYQRTSGHAAMEVRRLRAVQNARINEAIGGMSVLQAFNRTERFRGHFHDTNAAQYAARMRTVRISGLLLRSALDLIATLILAALLWVYGLEHLGSGAEIGVLYAFVTWLGRVSEPLIEITQRFNIFQQASVAGTRLLRLLDRPEAPEGTDTRPVAHAHLQLEEVHFRHHGAARDTLAGLTLDIPPGTFLGVVGPTGSGKSTLLDLLAGLSRVSEGSLTLDGRPVAELAPETLNTVVAGVPQEPFVRSTTLRDNLLLGSEADETRLAAAIDDAQLRELIDRLPGGLDTPLGERGLTLSTGERQLLAMARALLRQPRILLLDEATASVDSATETRLTRALEGLRGRVTLIVVAHRLSTIRHADRIVVIEDGRIIEQGSHAALLDRPDGHYHRLWHHRQRRSVEPWQ